MAVLRLGSRLLRLSFKESQKMTMKMTNRILILLAALGAAGFARADAPVRPNILYIMSDDHTAQAIGAYGSRLAMLNPTPTIDKLAREGMLFKNVFCNNSICTPSRASIITGQYSQANGVLTLDESLPVDRQYLPQEMKKLGYETAMIGKWHLKNEPASFDFYEVLPGQGNYFDPDFRVRGAKPWPNNTVSFTGYVSDIITDLGIEWLSKRKSDKPFFLMLHHKAPHDMFEFAPRYSNYLAEVEIPEPVDLYGWAPTFGSVGTRGTNDSLMHRLGTSVSKRHPGRNAGMDFGVDQSLPDREYTHQAYQTYLKRYLRCVRGVDDNLARLFDWLKAQDLYDNTVIMYTSDQGMMLGEHDYIDKRWMYEESMRMPFIMRYPPLIKAGSTNDYLINNTDFAPTMLALAGAEKTPSYMQGHSFLPSLLGQPMPGWRTATYYRYWMHLIHHDNPSHFGIRTKDYKLIFYYGLPFNMEDMGKKTMWWTDKSGLVIQTPAAWELYDLRKDPFETNNVYGNPEYSSVVAQLKQELKRTREELHETDEKYPHIQKVIDEHWND